MKGKKFIQILVIVACYLLILSMMVWFENGSSDSNINTIYDALWYSIITLTTVGYGDFYPVTPGGKIVSLIIIISSLGVLGYLLAQISRAVSEYINKKKMGLNGTDMKNHFVVIGWNSFANQILMQIAHSNHPMAVVTDNRDDVEVIRSLYPKSQLFILYNDHKDYEGLNNVNIGEASNVFVNFDDDTEALVYIINLKKRFRNLNLVALVESLELRDTFESVGVNYAISKNSITSKLIASYLFEPDVARITDDLMSTSVSEDDIDLLQFQVLKDNQYVGQDCVEVFKHLKDEFNAVLIGLSRLESGSQKLIKNPDKAVSVANQDYMIILATGRSKKMLETKFKVKEGRY